MGQAYRQPGYWTQGWQDWNTAVNPQGHESCLLVAAGVQFLRVAKLPRLIRDDGMCSRGLFIFLCHARGLSVELDSSLGKLAVVQSPCRATAFSLTMLGSRDFGFAIYENQKSSFCIQ